MEQLSSDYENLKQVLINGKIELFDASIDHLQQTVNAFESLKDTSLFGHPTYQRVKFVLANKANIKASANLYPKVDAFIQACSFVNPDLIRMIQENSQNIVKLYDPKFDFLVAHPFYDFFTSMYKVCNQLLPPPIVLPTPISATPVSSSPVASPSAFSAIPQKQVGPPSDPKAVERAFTAFNKEAKSIVTSVNNGNSTQFENNMKNLQAAFQKFLEIYDFLTPDQINNPELIKARYIFEHPDEFRPMLSVYDKARTFLRNTSFINDQQKSIFIENEIPVLASNVFNTFKNNINNAAKHLHQDFPKCTYMTEPDYLKLCDAFNFVSSSLPKLAAMEDKSKQFEASVSIERSNKSALTTMKQELEKKNPQLIVKAWESFQKALASMEKNAQFAIAKEVDPLKAWISEFEAIRAQMIEGGLLDQMQLSIEIEKARTQLKSSFDSVKRSNPPSASSIKDFEKKYNDVLAKDPRIVQDPEIVSLKSGFDEKAFEQLNYEWQNTHYKLAWQNAVSTLKKATPNKQTDDSVEEFEAMVESYKNTDVKGRIADLTKQPEVIAVIENFYKEGRIQASNQLMKEYQTECETNNAPSYSAGYSLLYSNSNAPDVYSQITRYIKTAIDDQVNQMQNAESNNSDDLKDIKREIVSGYNEEELEIANKAFNACIKSVNDSLKAKNSELASSKYSEAIMISEEVSKFNPDRYNEMKSVLSSFKLNDIRLHIKNETVSYNNEDSHKSAMKSIELISKYCEFARTYKRPEEVYCKVFGIMFGLIEYARLVQDESIVKSLNSIIGPLMNDINNGIIVASNKRIIKAKHVINSLNNHCDAKSKIPMFITFEMSRCLSDLIPFVLYYGSGFQPFIEAVKFANGLGLPQTRENLEMDIFAKANRLLQNGDLESASLLLNGMRRKYCAINSIREELLKIDSQIYKQLSIIPFSSIIPTYMVVTNKSFPNCPVTPIAHFDMISPLEKEIEVKYSSIKHILSKWVKFSKQFPRIMKSVCLFDRTISSSSDIPPPSYLFYHLLESFENDSLDRIHLIRDIDFLSCVTNSIVSQRIYDETDKDNLPYSLSLFEMFGNAYSLLMPTPYSYLTGMDQISHFVSILPMLLINTRSLFSNVQEIIDEKMSEKSEPLDTRELNKLQYLEYDSESILPYSHRLNTSFAGNLIDDGRIFGIIEIAQQIGQIIKSINERKETCSLLPNIVAFFDTRINILNEYQSKFVDLYIQTIRQFVVPYIVPEEIGNFFNNRRRDFEFLNDTDSDKLNKLVNEEIPQIAKKNLEKRQKEHEILHAHFRELNAHRTAVLRQKYLDVIPDGTIVKIEGVSYQKVSGNGNKLIFNSTQGPESFSIYISESEETTFYINIRFEGLPYYYHSGFGPVNTVMALPKEHHRFCYMRDYTTDFVIHQTSSRIWMKELTNLSQNGVDVLKGVFPDEFKRCICSQITNREQLIKQTEDDDNDERQRNNLKHAIRNAFY